MLNVSYRFINWRGRLHVVEENGYDAGVMMFNLHNPFELMPELTHEERNVRREEVNTRIEKMLSDTWTVEKERIAIARCAARVSHRALLKTLSVKERKRFKGPQAISSIDFPFQTKERWDTAHRIKFRKIVESEFPQFVAGDFRHPLHNEICFDTIMSALRLGVDERIVDLFISRLVETRKVSRTAAQDLFTPIAEDPGRLNDCFLVPNPKEPGTVPAAWVPAQWLQDLMKLEHHAPRRGKGELGMLLMYSGDVKLNPRGDLLMNGQRVEVKAIKKAGADIRLGSEKVWSESGTHQWLVGDNTLCTTMLKKYVTRELIEKNKTDITRSFQTLDSFIDRATSDMRDALASYGRIFVYNEEEETVSELQPSNAHFHGVSTEGRWKLTMGPNTLFQNL